MLERTLAVAKESRSSMVLDSSMSLFLSSDSRCWGNGELESAISGDKWECYEMFVRGG